MIASSPMTCSVASTDSQWVSELRPLRLSTPLLLVAASVLYYGSYLAAFPFSFADEGYLYYIAQRFGEGAVPYRDIHLVSYFPGLFYLFSPLAGLEEGAVIWARALMLVGLVAKVLLMWACARRIGGERTAVCAALIVMLVPGPWHKFYIGTLSLWVLYSILRYSREPVRHNAVLLGAAVGSALILRIDVAIAGVALAVLVLVFKARRNGASMDLLIAPLVALTLALPLLGFIFARGVATEYWAQWLSFAPRIGTRLVSTAAYTPPGLDALLGWGYATATAWVFYLAVLVVAANLVTNAATWLWHSLRRMQALEDSHVVAVFVVLWTLSGFPQFALERPDVGHLTQYASFVVLAGVLLFRCLQDWMPPRVCWTIGACIAGLFVAKHLYYAEGGSAGVLASPAHWVTLSSGFTYPTSDAEPYYELLEEVLERSQVDDEIIALPYAPGIAYATGRRLWGREVFLAPGSLVGDGVLEAYLRDLHEQPPRLVFYDTKMSYTRDDQGRLAQFAPGIHDALNTSFRIVSEHGSRRLLVPTQ